MAQLNDLIVNGYSRFLNSAYGNLNGSATSALCAAYAASTNTAIKVSSATSATCAYDVINKAINVNSAGSAAKAASATSALSAGSAAKAAELTNKAIKVNSAGTADYATSAGSAPFISHNHNYQLSGNGTALYISAGVNLKPNGNIAISTAANTINISAKDTTYTSLNGINTNEYNALTSTSANSRDPNAHQLSSHTNFSTYFNATSANSALTSKSALSAGYATSAGAAPVASHTHGTMESTFAKLLPNTSSTTWSSQFGVLNSGYWLYSIRAQGTVPAWFAAGYGAGIAFGGVDTKGVVSIDWNTPYIKFAGGPGKTSAGEPKWWFGFSGTAGKKYTLPGADSTLAATTGSYSGTNGLTALSSRGAYSASTANYSNSTNTAIKVNSAGSASTAAYASTYPVDYDSCVVTYGDTGCFTKIKNAYTANKKIYMLATVQSYPGNAGNSICKIPLTYSLITGTTYNCFSFNFVNDGGIGYWGSTAEQQGVVYSFTCSSDAAAGWHIKNVNPYASTLANTAGTANYINVNSSNTNTWFNLPLYSVSNNQFYYDSNYMISYNPNVDALSADNILTKAVASNQAAISWQAWKSCMLIYGSSTAHTIDLSNLSEDVVYWLFVGGPKTINLTHTANNISLHCYDTTFALNKSNPTTSAFSIRDNASFTTGAGTARYHGTFSVPIVKASSGDIFVMMAYGDCH